MNYSKPKTLGPERAVCPVCGQTAYSKGGIHPQCAVTRADRNAPRPVKVVEKKKPLGQWRKQCPSCKRELPARRIVCDCGHNFQPSLTG